jgi:N-acetylglucosamine-6-sulfatase
MHRADHIRPSRRALLASTSALLALLCALGLAVGDGGATAASGQRPSFVVIQTDDQTYDGLYATFRQPAIRAMPNTLDLIAKRGITFNDYYVSYPLCCPSRVSLLTGRYAHNTGVKGNIQPNGGYFGFSFRGAYKHNLAVWLQRAGYRTIHVGKFLNGYGEEPYSSGTEIPPGWNAWHTVLKADSTHYYYGYELNDNGQIDGPFGDSGSWETREYGVRDDPGCPFAPANGLPCHYETDTLTNIAGAELAGTPPDKPFYLQLDYTAPHGDFRHPAGPEPAPREYGWFDGAPPPHRRSQGFDEGNVGDKPRFIREAPYLSLNEIHTYRVYWDKQLEALRGVDDGVREIINTLGALHRLRNTYVIFTSDNGFFFGEHRLLGGKFLAYEPATHVPFLIRGPGIRPNTKSSEIAGNIDVAPTVLQLAHAEADKSVDGRSLVPFFRDPSLRTLRPYLFESFVETADVEGAGAIAEPGDQGSASSAKANRSATASILAPPKDYEGIRLGPYKYIAWPNGEKELYDLERDPDELNNLVRRSNYFPVRNFLHHELTERLEDCVGRGCSVEASRIPLTRHERQQLIRQKKRERREREQQHK